MGKADAATRDRQHRSRLKRVSGNPLFHLAVAVLVIALAQAFLVKIFTVPSASMENTLHEGDRILVNRLAYSRSASPADGDVVVFHADENWGHVPSQTTSVRSVIRVAAGALSYGSGNDHYLVKRVIGTPGQTISCCSTTGLLERDGVSLQEPYVFGDLAFVPGTLDCTSQTRSARCFGPIAVPAGRYLVLGDHRGDSSDSVVLCRTAAATRDCVRWVTSEEITGRAFAIFWPLGRIGKLGGS